MRRKNILVINPYPPQFSFGGPVISVSNMVKNLSSSFNFFIIAPYNIEVSSLFNNDENLVIVKEDSSSIYFTKNFYFIFFKLFRNSDIIYLNSVFEVRNFFILAISKIFNKKVILSTRGQLSYDALHNSKFILKNIFINIFRILSTRIKFISSDESESLVIKNHFNSDSVIIPNIVNLNYAPILHFNKKFIFYSRITKKKNLKLLIETIKDFQIPIVLDIYGFIEDLEYWEECLKIIEVSPNIFYRGIINRENLSDVLSDYNFFLFPTKNENYGHVIVESLFNGLIPIISNNTTPFSDFISNELGMGFELNKNSLKLKLESIVQVTNEEIVLMRDKCSAYCKQLNYLNDLQIDKYKKLFYE